MKFIKYQPFLTLFDIQVVVDAVKHFPINVPISMSALKSCNLKIEMIMYKSNRDRTITIEKRQMGVMLFHLKVNYQILTLPILTKIKLVFLQDVMHSRVITGSHEFSKDMTSMAKLELKVCYVAGMFGFGYSQRINFETDAQPGEFPVNIEEQLLLSLFPRYKPLVEGSDEMGGGIPSVKEVPLPDILPMFHTSEDPSGNKFMFESRWTSHPCASLMKDCDRLRRLRLILLSCDSYHLRKIFLEKLILNNQEMSFADIKRYKAQKEEDNDNLNILMEQAERSGSMTDKGFVRRMSSAVNPGDIKDLLKKCDETLKATRDASFSESSSNDEQRRAADPHIDNQLNAPSKWKSVKQFTFKNKVEPEPSSSDDKEESD